MKRIVSQALALVLVLVVQGCSVFDLANYAAPDEGFTQQLGLRYGDLPRQQYDLYLPDSIDADTPVIVYFYGGGWRDGSRDQYAFVGRKLAADGYIAMLPDYRVYPEVIFPEFVHDGALATARVLADYGNSNPVYLMGHSAGAHIAMMLSLNPDYLAAAGANSCQLSGVIGLSGPYDFLPITSRGVKKIFPTDALQQAAQPINFVDAGDPPALLLHGDRDRRVWTRNSKRLHARLVEKQVPSQLKIYPDISHGGILKSLVPALAANSSLLSDLQQFINTTSAESNQSSCG